MLDIALTEIERIEAKPVEEIRGSLARKADSDLVTVISNHPEIPESSPVVPAILSRMTREERMEWVLQFNTLSPEQIARAMESMSTDALEFGVRFEAGGHEESTHG